MDIAPSRATSRNFGYDVGAGWAATTAPRGGGAASSVGGRSRHHRSLCEEGRPTGAVDAGDGKLTNSRAAIRPWRIRSTLDGTRLVYNLSTPTRVGDSISLR